MGFYQKQFQVLSWSGISNAMNWRDYFKIINPNGEPIPSILHKEQPKITKKSNIHKAHNVAWLPNHLSNLYCQFKKQPEDKE